MVYAWVQNKGQGERTMKQWKEVLLEEVFEVTTGISAVMCGVLIVALGVSVEIRPDAVYAAAKAAQIKMIAELGNPFK